MTQQDLSALIGSRICHDLISPIGAITNGLELLELTGGAPGPEMALISDSVGNAGARIRFFRVAFGSPGTSMMATAEVVSILSDIEKGARMRIDWQVSTDHSRADVRLAFLSLLCVETALAFGGVARIAETDGHWVIEGKGERLNIDPVLWAGLAKPDEAIEITPALVQFALLPDAVAEQTRHLDVEISEDAVRLRY